MLRLRSFVYAARAWYHHLKFHYYSQVSGLVSHLAREDAKRSGKTIEIMNSGRLETHFPCGCKMWLSHGRSELRKFGIEPLVKIPCGAHYGLKFFGVRR